MGRAGVSGTFVPFLAYYLIGAEEKAFGGILLSGSSARKEVELTLILCHLGAELSISFYVIGLNALHCFPSKT